MRARPVAVLLPLVALLAGAGCSSSSDAAAPTTSRATTTTAAPTTTTTLPRATPPTVLEPGTSPRTTLRYRFAAGTHRTLVLRVQTSIDAGSSRLRPPAVEQVIDVAITAVDAGGTASIRLRVDRATVVPDPTRYPATALRAYQEAVAGLVGATYAGTMAPDGRATLEATDESGASEQEAPVTAEVRRAFEELGPQLPTAPVGVGARWRTTRAVPAGDRTVPVTTTWTVDGIDGDQVRLRVEQSGNGPAPTGSEDGAGSLALTGVGTATQDLALPLPAADLRSTVVVRVGTVTRSVATTAIRTTLAA